MRPSPLSPSTLLAALALAAAGCSGAGETPEPTPLFGQTAVTQAGALTVGGVPVRVRGALLRLLDHGTSVRLTTDADAAQQLGPGMVVSVKGTLDPDGRGGAAEEILHRAVVRGPLAGRADSLLAIAGADVVIERGTVLLDAGGAPTTLAALPTGVPLEVSGWPESGGRVRATRVRVLPVAPAVAVRGFSVGLPELGRFGLSLLPGGDPLVIVDASGLASAPEVPAGALVRAAGDALAGGGLPVLTATALAVESQLLPMPGDRAVLEGIVTGPAATGFVLGEHAIRVGPGTTIEGVPAGGEAARALGPGVRVVAEGTFSGGALAASRVRLVDLVRLAGRIVPGSFAYGSPAMIASFDLAGEEVGVDLRSELRDAAGASITILQLAELHGAELAGLPVVIHGYALADGTIQVRRLDVAAP